MKEKSITNNLLWKFAERFSAQIVSFVVSILLARILLPDDYGVVALIMVFIEIANVFVSQGLGSALIQKRNADNLDFSSVFYFNIGISVILYFVLFFSAPFISEFYESSLLTPILRVLGFRVILAGINTVQQAYVAKQMAFKKFFLSTIIGTIVSGVVGVVMAFSGCGAWALVAQYLTNAIIDTIILTATVKWRPILCFSWNRVLYLAKFGWKIFVEGIANTITGRIRNLIIGKVYTDSDLGFYTKAQSFPALFMTNINASVSAVLFPAMSNIQDEEEKLVLLMRRAVKISSYILFPLLFGLAAVGRNMILFLLTDRWIESVPYLYVFCFSSLLTVGMYARHEALKAKGKSGVFMAEHILSRIINLLVLFLVYRVSVMAIALSGIGGSLILFLIIMFTSKKYTNYYYRAQITDVVGLLLMSVFMFIPVFALDYLIDINPFAELLIQTSVGFVIYLALSIVFKPEGYLYISSFLKNIWRRKMA